MIKSMTGFGRGSASSPELTITMDIKSVNNKYLDIQVKMPGYLFPYEEAIKKAIRKRIARGRIDVYVRDEKSSTAKSRVSVDHDLAEVMYRALESINQKLGLQKSIGLEHVLINNEILEFKPVELDEEMVKTVVLGAAENALDAAMVMKLREGEILYDDLNRIVQELGTYIQKIELRAPEIIENYRERLETRVQNLLNGLTDYDRDRLNSEVVFYAERSDINEEIVRFKSHLQQLSETMTSNGSVGKKLDFIVQ